MMYVSFCHVPVLCARFCLSQGKFALHCWAWLGMWDRDDRIVGMVLSACICRVSHFGYVEDSC